MLTPEEFDAIEKRIYNGTASAEEQDAYQRSLQQMDGNVHIAVP